MQLRSLDGAWLDDRVAALTLAVALRDALAGLLGVSTDELGCDVKPARPEGGGQTWSILVYDRFAVGYASSAEGHLGRLFHSARDRLVCRADCDSACLQCVLDFDQRFLAEHLDRHRALALLKPEWLDALRLPESLAFFGAESRPEYAELAVALLREARLGETQAVRLFGSGAGADLGPSPLRHLAYRLAGAERPVELVLDGPGLAALEPEDRHLLASLADHPGVRVCRIPAPPQAGGGWVLAEVQDAGGTRRWAVPDPAGMRADGAWGVLRPLIGSGPIPGFRTETLEPLTAAALRPAPLAEGDREIEVQHELDGPIRQFGGRFWDLILAHHSGAATLLGKGGPDVVTLAYQDRYLRSPLPSALLVAVVDALRSRVGLGRWGVERLRVETCDDQPADQRYPGTKVWSDWPETGKRDAALGLALDYIGIEADIASLPRQATQHGRRLRVGLSDGRMLSVRLDQGLSYWRYATGGQGIGGSGRFDFYAPPDRQGEAIATLGGNVEGAAHPTQLFLAAG